MVHSFNNIISKLKIFMGELQEAIQTNHQIYQDTMGKLNYLLHQAEDTSATTEELSASMEEASASTQTINQAIDEIDHALANFAEKVEVGASTSGPSVVKQNISVGNSYKLKRIPSRFIRRHVEKLARHLYPRGKLKK